MFVNVELYDFVKLVRERGYVRANKSSLTRKINDLKRYISGEAYELYGATYCVVYVNDSHYCDIYYDSNALGKVVVSYVNSGSL